MRVQMDVIKFSANYAKLWNQKSARLIHIEEIMINENTSDDLLEYDTKQTDGNYYKLKKGSYLQLIFLGDKGIPFCTIRSSFGRYGSKKEYYGSKLGKLFLIKIGGLI